MDIRIDRSSKRTKYRGNYTPQDLADAYNYVIDGNTSIQRAAIQFGVPITTLKDRVKGRISIDVVTSGGGPIFKQEQEANLCHHMKLMGEIGFGYSRMEALNIASDYATQLNLREKKHPLTLNWLYSFLGRWPELKVRKPRALEIARAKNATRPAIDNYFSELEKILEKYNLKTKPNNIINIDEKGLTTEHKPPKIISGANYKAQAVTSGRSKNTTVIGGATAAGQLIPPYFVFAGKRMLDGLMDGATPGAAGSVSDSGWSNTEIFERYMKEHLIKYLPAHSADNHVLVLYDGHTSHVSLSLIESAKENHIILFVLPPHCSHLLQPLDVGCFGPFAIGWNAACHSHLRDTGGQVISRYEVCELACNVYNKTLNPSNIQSAFKRCGISPFNAGVINDSIIAPSLTFPHNLPIPNHASTSRETEEADKENPPAEPENFLEKKGGEILRNVKLSKTRKTLSRIVGGKPITEENIIVEIKNHIETTSSKRKGKTNPMDSKHGKGPVLKKMKMIVNEDIDSDSEDDIPDSDKCAVCHRATPENSIYIDVSVKWAQCDNCDKWVHLSCTSVKVVRRGDTFLCPSCRN